MYLLYDDLKESNEDIKIYCKTLCGDFYHAPWFSANPTWENPYFWFIESYGSEELRRSTMLEF